MFAPKTTVAVGVAALMLVALAGCSTGGQAGGDSGGKAGGKSICYVTLANSHPYVTPANKGAQDAAKKAGYDLKIVSEEFSAQTGAEQFNTCVSSGADGILFWPADENSYLPGLLAAEKKHIPVVAIDTKAGAESMKHVASFVGADKYGQGKKNAELLEKAMGGTGGFVIIAGQAGNGTEIARTGGFRDELKATSSQLKELAYVNADFDQQKALVASRDLITRFGDKIKGVYAEDDTMAAGFLQALAESGQTFQPVVVGINGQADAFQAIKDGKQYSTILQPPYLNGQLAIETLIKVMQGKKVPAVVSMPNDVVTKENVDSSKPAM